MPSEEKPNGHGNGKSELNARGQPQGMHPNSLAALEKNRAHMWQPGESGNPGGRPKGRSIQVHLDRAISDNDGEIAKALGKVIIREALGGDFKFCQLLLDRMDGKMVEKIAGPGGESLFRVVGLDVERIERRMDGDMGEE